MPPKAKFSKEEIVHAALEVASEKGIDAVTAREVAHKIGASTRPIFTYFDSMAELKAEVYRLAKGRYQGYIEVGLEGPVPFLGVGQAYIRFAREEPQLYRLLFLSKPNEIAGGTAEALRFTQDLVRDSIMRIYHMDAHMADNYFRDLWLVTVGFATLEATGECPFTDEEESSILTEMSLSVCKAYMEVPGLSTGQFDRDAVFGALVAK